MYFVIYLGEVIEAHTQLISCFFQTSHLITAIGSEFLSRFDPSKPKHVNLCTTAAFEKGKEVHIKISELNRVGALTAYNL